MNLLTSNDQTDTRRLVISAPELPVQIPAQSGSIVVSLREGTIENGWRLLRPLMLSVEREDDGWTIVSDDLFGIYGDAESFQDALCQYVSALIDHYDFLIRESHENPLVSPLLDHLCVYLRPVS